LDDEGLGCRVLIQRKGLGQGCDHVLHGLAGCLRLGDGFIAFCCHAFTDRDPCPERCAVDFIEVSVVQIFHYLDGAEKYDEDV
jgi:hypothetical protein